MKTLFHIAILIGVWQLVYLVVGNHLMWPSFDETIKSLIDMMINDTDGRFYLAAIGSLQSLTIVVGVIIGITVLMTLLGLMSRTVKDTLTTWGGMFGPVPGFTWLPIFFILFGMGINTVYALCVWTCIWFVLLQIFGQMDTAQKTWGHQVENLELGHWKALTLVYIPSLIPAFLSSVKISWNHTWRIVFAIEIAFGNLGGQHGLGILMSDYRGEFETTEVYALLLIVMFVGITVNKLLDLIETRFTWK